MGLETKEIRSLIVKKYNRRDTKLFQKFQKSLENDSNITPNQNISRSHQGFNKYLKKLNGVWIKHGKRGWIETNSEYYEKYSAFSANNLILKNQIAALKKSSSKSVGY